jgi:hypothetical protein
LLSGFRDEPAENRRESVRIAVARHRARNRLRLLLDGLAGGALLAWARRRRVWSAPAEAISYALVPTAAYLLITVGAWTGGAQVQPRESASGATLASQPRAVLSSPVATPAATAPVGAVSVQPRSRVETGPTQGPSTGVPLPDAHLSVPKPGNEQPARVDVRDKQPSDHLWCLTPPPEVGQPTSCVDSPVPLPATP